MAAIALVLGGCSSSASDVTAPKAPFGSVVRSNVAYALVAVPPDTGATVNFGSIATAAGTSVTFTGASTMSTPKFPEPTQLVTYSFSFSSNVTARQSPLVTLALAGASEFGRYVMTLTDTTSGTAIVKLTASSYANGSLDFPTTPSGITFEIGHTYAIAFALTTVIDLPPPSP